MKETNMPSTEKRSPTLYQPKKLPKCSSFCSVKRSNGTSPRRREASKSSPDEKRSSEIGKISQLVDWKLEYYFGERKKEQSFDVNGRFRTTPGMQKYDLMYKVAEITAAEKNEKSKRFNKSEKAERGDQQSKRDGANKVKPDLTSIARPFTLSSEANRVVSRANDIWDSEKLSKLTSINRYLPHTYMTGDELETTRVLTHSRHPYAVLHADHYVQFCKQNGLYKGNSTNNNRLLKLRPKANSTESDAQSHGTIGQPNGRSCEVGSRQRVHQKLRSDDTAAKKPVTKNQKSVQCKELKHKQERKPGKSPRKNETNKSSGRKVVFEKLEKNEVDTDQSDFDEEETDAVQENDSYSDDFEDEDKGNSGADSANQSYASLVHVQHTEE